MFNLFADHQHHRGLCKVAALTVFNLFADQSGYDQGYGGSSGSRGGHGDSGPNQNVGLANQEGGMNKQLGGQGQGGQGQQGSNYQWGQGFGSGFGGGFQESSRVKPAHH